MSKCSGSLAAALLLFAVSHVGAQAPQADRVAAVQALRVGQHVRVLASRVGLLEGSLILANDMNLTLTHRGQLVQIRLPEVEHLWVRGRSTGNGALFGAGVGVLAGVVYGLLISTVACEPIDGGACTAAQLAAVTGLLGGVGGAVLGAGVGFAIPVWRSRFP